MKKLAKRVASLMLAMLMILEVITPLAVFAMGEERMPKHLSFRNYQFDENTFFHVIPDGGFTASSGNHLNVTLTTSGAAKEIKLIVKKDYQLFDESTYQDAGQAQARLQDLQESLKGEGLELDAQVAEERTGKTESLFFDSGEDISYRIKNNFDVDQFVYENFLDPGFKENYRVYSLKVLDSSETGAGEEDPFSLKQEVGEEKEERNPAAEAGEVGEDLKPIDFSRANLLGEDIFAKEEDQTPNFFPREEVSGPRDYNFNLEKAPSRASIWGNTTSDGDYREVLAAVVDDRVYTLYSDPSLENEKPDTGNFEPEKPDTEDPQSGKTETEIIEPGKTEGEDPQTKKPEIEDPQTEKPGTEDPQTEKPNTEDPQTEKPGTEANPEEKLEASDPQAPNPVGADANATTYPYSLPYNSHQYYENGYMNWDITIDTSKLVNRTDLTFASLGLALYAPEDQGLSDYRVSIDELNVSNVPITNKADKLYKYNRVIGKTGLPSSLTVHVKAKVDVPANSYSLGLRLTPDANYILNLGKELQEKAQESTTFLPPLSFIINYVKNLSSLTKFQKGFNLIDARLTTSPAEESTYDEFRTKSYGDTSRFMFGSYNDPNPNLPNDETIDFTVSETLRLEEINDPNIMNNLGDDVYAGTFKNASVATPFTEDPDVRIFTPNVNGTYTLRYIKLGAKQSEFKDKLWDLNNVNLLAPGTIIQYTWHTKPLNKAEASKMNVNFQNRTETDGTGTTGGLQTASFLQRQAQDLGKGYHITWQTTALDQGLKVTENKPVANYTLTPTHYSVMRVAENYDQVWCINWGAQFPMHDNFWNPNLPDWEISRMEIKSPEDLSPYLQSRNGVLASPHTAEYIYDKLKQGFYFAKKYPEEVGVRYNLDGITQYNGLMADYIGELTSDPEMYQSIKVDYVGSGYNTHLLDQLKKTIEKHQAEWTPEVADSVKLIVYHNSKDTVDGVVGLASSTYQNVITGKVYDPVQIAKVDENGEALAGASFRLTGDKGSVRTWTSTDKPEEVYLDPGSYTLEEVLAPPGRDPIAPYSFTLKQEKDGANSLEEGDIPLLKTNRDQTASSFTNGNFIVDKANALIRETNRSFTANTSKYVGGNFIAEKRFLEEEGHNDKVSLSSDGLKISVSNPGPGTEEPGPKYGQVVLKKTGENGRALAGAEFTLTGNGSSLVKTSAADGLVVFSHLAPGQYVIRETKAPAGYAPLAYQYKVLVNEYGVTTVTEEAKTEASLVKRVLNSVGDAFTSFFTANDLGQNIQVTSYELSDGYPENGPTVYANATEPIRMKVQMTLKDGSAKKGDTFEITLDEGLQPYGLTPTIGDAANNFYPPTILKDNEVIATGNYDKAANRIVYTFTDYVESHSNVTMELELNGMGPNRKHISSTGDYTFKNTIAGESKESTLYIDYEYAIPNEKTVRTAHSGYPTYMNSKKFIAEWNRDLGKIKHVTYLNLDNTAGPNKPTRLTFKNQDGSKNLDLSAADIKVYKVANENKGTMMVESMDPDTTGLGPVGKTVNKVNGTAYIDFSPADFVEKAGYIVVAEIPVQSPRDSINLVSNWDTLTANGVISTGDAYIHGIDYVKSFEDSAGGTGEIPIDRLVPNERDNDGKFIINKTDQDGLALPGAEFTLTRDDDPSFKMIGTSDESGQVEFTGLKAGTYTLVESKAPEGYQKSDKSWQVTVDGNGIATLKEIAMAPAFLRARLRSMTASPDLVYDKEGQYGDFKVRTRALDIGDRKYSLSMDFETVGNKALGKEDIIFVVPQFAEMTNFGIENYRQAVLSTLKDLQAMNTNDNIHVGIIGYSDETNTSADFIRNSTNGLLSLDKAISFVENNTNSIFTPKPTIQDDKGLITAINKVSDDWLLYTTGNAFGARADAHKTFIVGASDFYWTNNNSTNGFKESDFNAMGAKFDSLLVRYGSGVGLPTIKTILLPGCDDKSWNTYFGKYYGDKVSDVTNTPVKDGFTADQFKSAMKFYGSDLSKVPLKIRLNDDFNLTKGPVPVFDPRTNQYTETTDWQIFSKKDDPGDPNRAGWHTGYDEGSKTILLKSGELSLTSGHRASISFVLQAQDGLESDKELPLINDVTLNGTTIPVPRVSLAQSQLFKLKADWGELIPPPGAEVTVEFSNGVTETLDDGVNNYSGAYSETELPLDSTITNVTLPKNYSYRIDGNPGNYTIVIYKDAAFVPSITVENRKVENRGKFTVSKKDEEGKALANAEFTLTKDGRVYASGISDSMGKISFSNLEAGTYSLTETKAPDGYTGTGKSWTITVDVNGVTKVTSDEPAPAGTGLMENPLKEYRTFELLKSYGLEDQALAAALSSAKDGEGEVDPMSLTDQGQPGSGQAAVKTAAVYNKETKDFTLSLDIQAGKDTETDAPMDVVLILPYHRGIANQGFDQYKAALLEWLSFYKDLDNLDSLRVGFISYANNQLKDTGNLTSPKQAYNQLNGVVKSTSLATTGAETAFKRAKEMLNGTNSRANADKIIVHATTQAPAINTLSNNMKGINKAGDAKLSVYNFNLGSSPKNVMNNTQNYKTEFDKVGNIDSINNYNFLGSSKDDFSPIEPKPKEDYLAELPLLKRAQVAVKDGRLTLPLNSDFKYVEGSLKSSKANPDGPAWADLTNGAITLKAGELGLKAGQTAHLEFKLSPSPDLEKDKWAPLVENIRFKVRDGEEAQTIPSPRARVHSYEDNSLSLTVTSLHKGTKTGTIRGSLKRKINGSPDENFERDLSLTTNTSQSIEGLVKKDAAGNSYEYYLEDLKAPQGILIESTSYDAARGSIEIYSRDIRGFEIKTNWNGLTPVGTITVNLSNGTSLILDRDAWSHAIDGLDAESIKVEDIQGSQEGYDYQLIGNQSPYVINVTKAGDTGGIPNIDVINKKDEKGHFQIKKTNADGSKPLAGAVFQLKQGETLVKEVTSGPDGLVSFTNLDPGDYLLKESKAPEGYTKADKTWKVHVDEKGTTSVKELVFGEAETSLSESIQNSTATKLYKYSDYGLVYFWQSIEKTGDGQYSLAVNYKKAAPFNYTYPLKMVFDTENFEVKNEDGQSIKEFSIPNFNASQNAYPQTDYFEFTLKLKNTDFEGSRTLQPVQSFFYAGVPMGVPAEGKSYYATITQSKTVGDRPIISEKDVNLSENNEFTVENTQRLSKFKLHKRDGIDLDKNLQNVEFTLTRLDENNQPLAGESPIVKKTDGGGNIEFTDLPDGKYKLEESKKIDGYYDILIDFIVQIKDGKVSYTRVLKEESHPELAKTNATKTVSYNVEFLPKGEAIPSYKIDLYSDSDGSKPLETKAGAGDHESGSFTRTDPKNYYVQISFDDPAEASKWQASYIKAGGDKIQVILYKKDAFEELGTDQNIQIRNFPIQEGEGKLKVLKKDSRTNKPLQGVEFNIRGSNGYNENFTTDANGQIILDKLANGIYTIVEVSAPEGYILDKTPRQVIIGGNYKVPENAAGKDVTDKVHFAEEPELHVSNEEGDQESPKVVKPNDSEGLNITSKYRFDEGIKAGDYFYLEVSKNMNTWGIYPPEHSYDLNLAGPMGLLANGEFVKNYDGQGNNAIKYTFTDYLNAQYPETASSIVSYFIDENTVKDNTTAQVYTKLGGDTKANRVQIFYTPNTYYGFTEGVNSVSRLVQVDWVTGKYKEIIYVNRYKYRLDQAVLDFGHDPVNGGSGPNDALIKVSYNDSVKVYKAKRTSSVDQSMPKSFGLNYDLLEDQTAAYKNNNSIYINNNRWIVDFGSDMYYGDAYVVVVDGSFNNQDTSKRLWFRQNLQGWYWNDYYGNWYWDTATNATFNDPYINTTTSDGWIAVTVPNTKNRIEYTKMSGKIQANLPLEGTDPKDPQGGGGGSSPPKAPMLGSNTEEFKLLSGAEFELRRKDGSGNFVKIDGSERTSGEDGKFFWEGLSPGEYQVWETKAPEGYQKPKDFVSAFTVSEDGDITNIYNNSLIIINEKESKANLEIIKKDFADDSKVLAGAEFSLYRLKDGQDPKTEFTQANKDSFEQIGEKATTGQDGKISFSNLQDGIYYIKEEKAPEGYANIPRAIGPITISDGQVMKANENPPTKEKDKYEILDPTQGEDGKTTNNSLLVYNTKAAFPDTGGMGTLFIILLGALMMATSWALYRRKYAKE